MSDGATPGFNSAAAASAQASIALCSSVFVTKSRPRSITMPRKPISTASEIPTKTRTVPFWRARAGVRSAMGQPRAERAPKLPAAAPGADIEHRESRGGRLERVVVLADRVDGRRAVDAGDRIRVAGCIRIERLLRLRGVDSYAEVVVQGRRGRRAAAERKQPQADNQKFVQFHSHAPYLLSKPPALPPEAEGVVGAFAGVLPSIFPSRKYSVAEGSWWKSVGSA